MVFREWSEVEAAPESPERDALLQFRSSITPQETDPATSLRFLRARNLNAAKANAMFFEYLNWRNIERVDGILTETVDSNVRLPGPASPCIQTGLTDGANKKVTKFFGVPLLVCISDGFFCIKRT